MFFPTIFHFLLVKSLVVKILGFPGEQWTVARRDVWTVMASLEARKDQEWTKRAKFILHI